MVTLTVPSFPFESKVVFYTQNIMIQCGALILLILNCNESKNEIEKQRSPPNHRQEIVKILVTEMAEKMR